MFGLHRMGPALRAIARRARFEAEMDDELSFHVERLTEDNVKAGMPPDEARRVARLSFGGMAQIKEECRDTRPVRIGRDVVQDFRYGLRTLAQNPGFAVVTILTLALGIGANTAIFSLIDNILLKDLPVRTPEEIVIVEPFHGENGRAFSYPMFRDLARRQKALSGMYATGGAEFVRVRIEGQGDLALPETLSGRFVSSNHFSVLGVEPFRGRSYGDSDQEVVISYRFWETQFARDPSALGRVITLNQAPFVIVGIAGKKFFGESPGANIDIWIPITAQPRLERESLLEARTASWFRTMGRVKPGTAVRDAEASLTTLYRQLLADEIAAGTGSLIHKAPRLEDIRVVLAPGGKGFSWHRQQLSQPLGLLMLVVAVVLMIACCNVAGLLLARASFRRREICIRLALGAGRLRLIRQFLTESLLLALLGGIAGFAMFFGVRPVLLRMASVQLDLQPDWRLMMFAVAVTTVTGLLFGLVPALQATKVRVVTSNQAGLERRSRLFLPRLLVVGQIALSLSLLVGAGLLVKTLRNFQDFDPGFSRHNVLLIALERQDNAVEAKDGGIGSQILEQLDALPGIHSASLCDWGFFSGSANTSPVRVPESGVNPDADGEVRTERVSPRYFETLGMRLLIGRPFAPSDRAVAIINSTMARHYFPGSNPLGRLLYFPRLDEQHRYVPFSANLEMEQPVEIVGVVQDAKYDNLRERTPRMAYLPRTSGPVFQSSVIVRASSDPANLVGPIRDTLRQAHPNLVIRELKTLADQVDQTLSHEQLVTELLSFFSLLALGLACIGLYGLTSYSVGRRTQEIGIRMALGAHRRDAVGMVLKSSAILVGLGIIFGLPIMLAASRLIEHFLFGVKPFDPRTIGGAAGFLLLVSVLASYIPARRASQVDPALTLRKE